jgi:hypothetical protein
MRLAPAEFTLGFGISEYSESAGMLVRYFLGLTAMILMGAAVIVCAVLLLFRHFLIYTVFIAAPLLAVFWLVDWGFMSSVNAFATKISRMGTYTLLSGVLVAIALRVSKAILDGGFVTGSTTEHGEFFMQLAAVYMVPVALVAITWKAISWAGQPVGIGQAAGTVVSAGAAMAGGAIGASGVATAGGATSGHTTAAAGTDAAGTAMPAATDAPTSVGEAATGSGISAAVRQQTKQDLSSAGDTALRQRFGGSSGDSGGAMSTVDDTAPAADQGPAEPSVGDGPDSNPAPGIDRPPVATNADGDSSRTVPDDGAATDGATADGVRSRTGVAPSTSRDNQSASAATASARNGAPVSLAAVDDDLAASDRAIAVAETLRYRDSDLPGSDGLLQTADGTTIGYDSGDGPELEPGGYYSLDGARVERASAAGQAYTLVADEGTTATAQDAFFAAAGGDGGADATSGAGAGDVQVPEDVDDFALDDYSAQELRAIRQQPTKRAAFEQRQVEAAMQSDTPIRNRIAKMSGKEVTKAAGSFVGGAVGGPVRKIVGGRVGAGAGAVIEHGVKNTGKIKSYTHSAAKQVTQRARSGIGKVATRLGANKNETVGDPDVANSAKQQTFENGKFDNNYKK